MFPRALVGWFLFSFVLAALVHAQVGLSSTDNQDAITAQPVVVGQVLRHDGKPAEGVRIELDDASTAMPAASSYTRRDGSFSVSNVTAGVYEVIATSGDSQVSDMVVVNASTRRLGLRLPRNIVEEASNQDTVSVASLLVSEKAQKLYRKAMDAFQRGRDEQAEQFLDQALLLAPEYADALTLRGFMQLQKQDLEAAQKYLEQAVRIDPGSAKAYVALSGLYNREGRFDDALQASQRCTLLAPRFWQGYFEMARASLGKGMYRKALVLARRAERLGGSSFAGLHLIKAYALYPLKFYKDARYEVRTVLARSPKSKNAKEAATLLAQIDAAMGTEIAATK